MSTILIILITETAGFIILYYLLKYKTEKNLDPRLLIGRVREEVNQIIIEMNQTTDRNIALIEDKISNLMDLLKRADKQINLLKKESNKNIESNQLYNQLKSYKKTLDIAAEKENIQEKILRLYGEGFSSSVIAGRTGMPIGEVELIISLAERKS